MFLSHAEVCIKLYAWEYIPVAIPAYAVVIGR